MNIVQYLSEQHGLVAAFIRRCVMRGLVMLNNEQVKTTITTVKDGDIIEFRYSVKPSFFQVSLPMKGKQ